MPNIRVRIQTLPLLLALGTSACHRATPANVLLVTFDTTRADRIGAYGHGLAHTPTLDRLAAEGVRCTDAISSAPITMPAHASLMTGLLPPAHGVRDNGAYALGADTVTLAERLKARGYATQAFVSAIVLSRRYGLEQGFDGYDDDLWAEDEPRLFMIRERPAARTAERALAWFEAWWRRPASDRPPFFVWVHFFDPHQPLRPPNEDRRVAKDLYDAEISAADRALGQIVEGLRSHGVLDHTWVVMAADHGESLGEHQEKTHAVFVYDATVRVPLILRAPRGLPAGRVYAGPVRTIDVVPTLLSGLGLPAAAGLQGRDLLAELRGERPPVPLPQYSESLLSELGFGMAPLYAVRLQGYKLIRAPRPELYDLQNDPHELTNIYERERPRAARLERELAGLLADSAQRAQRAEHNPLTEESEEALRALGYVAPAAERQLMAGRDPKDGIGIYNQLEEARHLAQRKQWPAAERQLRAILAELPGHVSARNVLGLCLLRQGLLSDAKREYVRSLQDDPAQFRIVGVLGSLALLAGDRDGAERHYQAALTLAPTFVEARAGLGFIKALRGDDKGARDEYDRAMALDPNVPLVHRRLGDLYYERHDYASARRAYERALAKSADDFQSLIQAGNCAKHLGDASAARGYFDRAQRLRKDSWVPAYNRACLEARQGDLASALGQLDAALARGFRGVGLLERDPELERLRGNRGFQERLHALRLRVPRGYDDGDGE